MDQRQIQAMLAELQAELQHQRDQISSQANEITFLRTMISSRSTKPKSSLPDPEKFTGQAHKFDTWLPSIKAKLQVDGEAIGDATAQFYYVYLNLDSHVQAIVLPQLTQAETSTYDFHTILDQLTRVYDNPNKVQEAEDKLYALKQGTDSLHAYMAKFERVLYEARGQDWPDVNKISSFRNGLSPTLRSRLAQQLNLPRTYSDFIRVVQQLAGRSSTSATPFQPQASSTNYSSHQPMDLNAISINSIQPTPRARSTSPERRQQYRTEGRCVRCGSQDHWVQDCLLRPFSPGPTTRKQLGPKKGKVTVAAIDDAAYDSNEWLDYESDDPRHPDAWQKNIFQT